jgi:hypothetical protein
MRVPITTDSRHSHAIAPNLLVQKFNAALPDAVWLADISETPTDGGALSRSRPFVVNTRHQFVNE